MFTKVLSVFVLFGASAFAQQMDPMFLPDNQAKAMIVGLHGQADNLNTLMFQAYDGALEIWKQTLIYTSVDTGKPIAPKAMDVDEAGVKDYFAGKRKDLPGITNYSPTWYMFAREKAGTHKREEVMPPVKTIPPAPKGYHYVETPFGLMGPVKDSETLAVGK